jgi:hypothetical protein
MDENTKVDILKVMKISFGGRQAGRATHIQHFLSIEMRHIDCLEHLLVAKVPLQPCWCGWDDLNLAWAITLFVVSKMSKAISVR